MLAALYILFSTVLKINPNRRRSIVTFLLFGAGAFGWLMRAGQPALALGCLLVSAIVVLKHSRLFVKAAQTAAEPTPKNNAEKMAPTP